MRRKRAQTALNADHARDILRTMKSAFAIMALLLACPALCASDAQRILDAFNAARPSERDLGVFKLDWADSLKDAKARAAKERRPIFFVSTTQLKEAGNLRDGHC